MNAPSFLQRLRVTRRRCKSQAFVEFAFILPIFLVMMMCVFDYSFMVMRQQILAMAAREGANTASRQLPDVAINEGLNAAYDAARSVSVDFSGPLGGVVSITTQHGDTPLPLFSFGADGGTFGTYHENGSVGGYWKRLDYFSGYSGYGTQNSTPDSQ